MNSNRYVDLYFENVKKSDIPHTPRSSIDVIHLQSTINGKRIGSLSPECINAKEIEYYANAIIKELENIKKKALKNIQKSNKRFNLIKPFVMVFAEQQCKTHANPSP